MERIPSQVQSLQTVKPTEGSLFKGVYFVVIAGQQFANPSVSWLDIVAIAADEFQQDQMHSQGHFS
jgi:hypothetical protein